jgi:hypothetical protein
MIENISGEVTYQVKDGHSTNFEVLRIYRIFRSIRSAQACHCASWRCGPNPWLIGVGLQRDRRAQRAEGGRAGDAGSVKMWSTI